MQLIDANQDNNRVSNWAADTTGNGWRFFSFTSGVSANPGNRLSLYLTNIAADVYLDDISMVPGSVAFCM